MGLISAAISSSQCTWQLNHRTCRFKLNLNHICWILTAIPGAWRRQADPRRGQKSQIPCCLLLFPCFSSFPSPPPELSAGTKTQSFLEMLCRADTHLHSQLSRLAHCLSKSATTTLGSGTDAQHCRWQRKPRNTSFWVGMLWKEVTGKGIALWVCSSCTAVDICC